MLDNDKCDGRLGLVLWKKQRSKWKSNFRNGNENKTMPRHEHENKENQFIAPLFVHVKFEIQERAFATEWDYYADDPDNILNRTFLCVVNFQWRILIDMHQKEIKVDTQKHCMQHTFHFPLLSVFFFFFWRTRTKAFIKRCAIFYLHCITFFSSATVLKISVLDLELSTIENKPKNRKTHSFSVCCVRTATDWRWFRVCIGKKNNTSSSTSLQIETNRD